MSASAAVAPPIPLEQLDLSPSRIRLAMDVIEPTFLNTPQFVDDQLCAALGRRVLVKVETANPLRSFKGRGADFALAQLGHVTKIVCASTGNFGQAVAYAGRRRGIAVVVFVPADANPLKVDRMRAFGARVIPIGVDSAASKDAAQHFAAETPDATFLEDGSDPAVAEGAGTIGVELLASGPIDTLVLPVGDGALITGVARWVKEYSPGTRIVGVCSSGAPSMFLSWRAGQQVVTDHCATIAEGIEVRIPVPESVVRMRALVDDMVLVDDGDLLRTMAVVARTLGLLIEPAGAAGLAALRAHDISGERVATVLTGSNLRPEHARTLLSDTG